MKFDIHVHTTLSPCSQLELADILARAQVQGLDGVCITDHDTMAVRHQLNEGIQANGLCVIFGMEYATAEGDFLLFGPYEGLRPGLPARLVLRHVADTGGVAVAAHPFRARRPTSEHLIHHRWCRIVEGVNGRNSVTENQAVIRWEQRYGVSLVGGSDAHALAELGRVPTELLTPVTTRSEFIQALRRGTYRQVRPRELSCRAA
ncbi:histidinol-phosphatase [Desulfolithobacter dissulfuricans]|uniref:Histidinol-phosphatase n=1 Tax=Desulfolithobacter dissulfuricans TaxID=2795293 RepID=A0A915U3Q2_9BACT|nr:PHP domain-containing protein [Desulfolithobacter dissulfuricans]BCO10784.1 histidinol-phosphatase [Desulfolithobacter dissulfuricans]